MKKDMYSTLLVLLIIILLLTIAIDKLEWERLQETFTHFGPGNLQIKYNTVCTSTIIIPQ